MVPSVEGRVSGSTFDTCDFVPSWMIRQGHYGALAPAGLHAAVAGRWDNAEPPQPGFPAIRPPRRLILHLDERASPEQRQALEAIFRGQPARRERIPIGPW